MGRYHDPWVMTADYQREKIEKFVGGAPAEFENVHFIYVAPRPWHYRETRFWQICERTVLKPLMHWSYGLWQRDAYSTAVELHRSVRFDLAHQLTFVGFRFPGHLWKLGIPFVWGPVGGLENTPWRLLPSIGLQGCFYYAARNVVNSIHKRFLRRPREGFARAGQGVIAATSTIQREIFRWYGIQSQVICEVGTSVNSYGEHSLRANGEPMRLAWSGRHLPGKALPFLLHALHTLPEAVDWRLDIYGDGPCHKQWRALASRFGMEARCTWHGQVTRNEALSGLSRAHLFVITSIKDLTSTVILEALAAGVPVICPDHCGFSDVITDECGIKLPISRPQDFEGGLARTLAELSCDEQRRRLLARGALRRALDFSWDAKAAAVNCVYQKVIAGLQRESLEPAVPVQPDAQAYS
jgi:glycosyltransferase involved in cell wall biosynthesis